MRSPWIEIAVNAINDKKGQNTLIIDVGEVLGISDNFVITSGGNTVRFAHWLKKSNLK